MIPSSAPPPVLPVEVSPVVMEVFTIVDINDVDADEDDVAMDSIKVVNGISSNKMEMNSLVVSAIHNHLMTFQFSRISVCNKIIVVVEGEVVVVVNIYFNIKVLIIVLVEGFVEIDFIVELSTFSGFFHLQIFFNFLLKAQASIDISIHSSICRKSSICWWALKLQPLSFAILSHLNDTKNQDYYC